MQCREKCGACCIAPSIKQSIPNMPDGKVGGELCANLDPLTFSCRIWGQGDYPDFCQGFTPEQAFCGDTRDEALQILTFLEDDTHPYQP